MLMLAGCQMAPAPEETNAPATEVIETEETAAPETEPPETEPEITGPTAPPDGNPNDVTAKGSYTTDDNSTVLGAHNTVATIGGEELTNAHLQIYYWMAVKSYREAGNGIAPDFSQPLDTQMCELENGEMTWQQYFLQQALDTWHSYQALVLTSQTYNSPLEEAYVRNEKKHTENLKTEIYNLDLLYGYNTAYTISDAHQKYLDAVPTMLEQLAVDRGYESLSALVKDLAGIGTAADYLVKYAELCNEGYMFTTTLSYYIEPTTEEVEAFFTENEKAYADAGITKDSGHYVNIRHIMLVPEDGTTNDDGTVTYSKSAWSSCESSANSLLKKWKGTGTEAYFAELAFANSADTGSNGSGGLYSGISQGQLTEEMDDWCFDADRKAGDTTIIKTDSGYHILYFSGTTHIWFDQAEKDLIAQELGNQIAAARESYPMSVDYSAIRLGLPQSDEMPISVDEMLYPDIAHERFPEAPLYFQQDYEGTKYGNYPLVTYGCGITTMSMLASYMTDDEWTPPEMCALYGKYCSDKGTAHTMFTEVPTDRGFYCVDRVYTWDEALPYLEDGYMVVTLQRDGYWTRGGHYLLLHNLIETAEGTKVQVRDSNILNYKKLEGHTTGSFDLSTIPTNARSFWIYQKKVVRIDTCARCGEPTEESVVPTDMFEMSYYCPKCLTAMNRRDAYLAACGIN